MLLRYDLPVLIVIADLGKHSPQLLTFFHVMTHYHGMAVDRIEDNPPVIDSGRDGISGSYYADSPSARL